MSKIIRFVSKSNKYNIDVVICDDDKVEDAINNHKEYDYKVLDWFG